MSSKGFKSVISQNEPSTSLCNAQTETSTNLSTIIKDVKLTRLNKWLILPRSKDNVIKIKVDGKTFFIKKNVLIKHSLLFQKALPQHSDKVAVALCLIGVSKLTFQVIKDWMKGKKNVINRYNAQQVMDVAEKLEMTDLLNECKQLVRQHGGLDDGKSDSSDSSSSESDASVVLEHGKKKDKLDKPKASRKEEIWRKIEQFMHERKKKKRKEEWRKAEKKRRKAQTMINEKRKRELEIINEKINKEMEKEQEKINNNMESINSIKGDAVCCQNSSCTCTSCERFNEEFAIQTAELPLPVAPSSFEGSSSPLGSETSENLSNAVKETKRMCDVM